MSRSSFVLVSKSLLVVLILVWAPAGAQPSPADPGQADLERLKQRVNEYFSAVHARRFTRASQFILPGSRDAGEAARPGRARIGNLRIHEIKLEEGSGSAVVSISRQVSAPAGSVRVKEKLRWKKEAGEWFLDPADPPKSDAEIFTEYYYKKRGSPTVAKFEETVFDFGRIVQGDPVRPRFSFRNPSSRDLVVEKIHDPNRFITDRTQKRLIPAGESAEIHLELNTARLRRRFRHVVFVQFEPVREMVALRIKGWVYTAEEIARSPTLSREFGVRKSPAPADP